MMTFALLSGSAIAHATASNPDSEARSSVAGTIYLSQRIRFQPPDRGAPPATIGSGSRSAAIDRSIKVLVPTATDTEDEPFGLTLDDNPTLWVYVTPLDNPTAELSLRVYGFDAQPQDPLFVRQTFAMPTEAGLVALPLLPDGDTLRLDTPYEWVLSIQNENVLSSSEVASGWIERTTLEDDLMAQLDTAEMLDQVALYATEGLWHNMIDTLIQIQTTADDPAIAQVWNDVLSDAGLDAIAIEPILTCCRPSPLEDAPHDRQPE